MRLLVLTNLYPPQELGGYGRSIADFTYGLQSKGYKIDVLTSDASYLYRNSTGATVCPDEVTVNRGLALKGSYAQGVSLIQDPRTLAQIDKHNQSLIASLELKRYDGFLVGNLDLLGRPILNQLLDTNKPIVHHLGFVTPPFSAAEYPSSDLYIPVCASNAVKRTLLESGFPVTSSPIVYPGVRTDLFAQSNRRLSSAPLLQALGSRENPLCVGFAGLIMQSKGLHIIVDALLSIVRLGLFVNLEIAGDIFDHSYWNHMQSLLSESGPLLKLRYRGHLDRTLLSQFWSSQHIGVFPSVYPEAFGIVSAEIMASGTPLISSCAGGADEQVIPFYNALKYQPGDPRQLAEHLISVIKNPHYLMCMSERGRWFATQFLSLRRSCTDLDKLFIAYTR